MLHQTEGWCPRGCHKERILLKQILCPYKSACSVVNSSPKHTTASLWLFPNYIAKLSITHLPKYTFIFHLWYTQSFLIKRLSYCLPPPPPFFLSLQAVFRFPPTFFIATRTRNLISWLCWVAYNRRTLKSDALKALASYYKADKNWLFFCYCCWLTTASLHVS